MNTDLTANKVLRLVILGSLPEIFVALVFMILNDGSWQAFGITLAIIYTIYFLIWLKNTIWEWVLFSISGREEIKKNVFNFLKDNSFPEPDIYSETINDYFENVANDNDIPGDIRVKAALQLGVIGSISQLGKIQRAIRVSMAMNDGFKKYKKSFENKALSNNEPFQI